MITPEDERRYNLKPLPDVPFCGAKKAKRLREAYEVSRKDRNMPLQRGTCAVDSES